MASDATSLCSCSMYDGTSTYHKTEAGCAFAIVMNAKLVEDFNQNTFNKSAILKVKFYNPPNIKLQYVPITKSSKKVKKK